MFARQGSIRKAARRSPRKTRTTAGVLLALMALTAAPASTAAPKRDALGVDVAKARRAMAEAARKVGPMPAELAEYFSEVPYSMAHARDEALVHVQPDGSTFTAKMRPFEQGGGQMTPSGHLVLRGVDGWWRYATYGTGTRFTATNKIVGRDAAPEESRADNRSAALKAALAEYIEKKVAMQRWLSLKNRSMAAAAEAAAEPVVFKIPILLFKTNNEDFQEGNDADRFQKMFNGFGTSKTGTVTELYMEMSFGKLLVQFETFGPYVVSISNNEANNCWYGTDGGPVLGSVPEPIPELTGFGGLGLGGYGAKGMALEAVPQADPEVDFSEFDNDGDNYVDFLVMLHSGNDAAATGNPCHTHSHFFAGVGTGTPVGRSEPTPPTADGVLVGPVITVPEVDGSIGVVAHELMHALGEPDYYGTAGTQGTGDWDLGAGGSWSGIPAQTNPIHFNPLMKINFGWVKPRIINATSRNVSLRPRASYPEVVLVPTRVEPAGSGGAALCDKQAIGGKPGQNRAFLLENGDCLAEGYLIENLSRVSAQVDSDSCAIKPASFDRQAYASGLAVWHWDFTNWRSLGNNVVLRPMLDIEEFDRRDNDQDLTLGITRAEPLDLFWGDPVGISSATQLRAPDLKIPAPAGSPWTVTASPDTTEHTPSWSMPVGYPAGVSTTVTLSWETEDVDDWDLAVERKVGAEWVEAGADGAPPASGAETVSFTPEPGEVYRARATNSVSASEQATVSVAHDPRGVSVHGPAGTLDNELRRTGWQITNIRPTEHRGLAQAMEQVSTPITFDLVKHTNNTVDVSGDFLRQKGAPVPVIAGQPLKLTTFLYNHGGRGVNGATIALYDRDPANGGAPIASMTRNLSPYDREEISFTVTPKAGESQYFVATTGAADINPANDVVRTDIVAQSSPVADLLVVDNDRGWDQEEPLEATLRGLGVRYHVVEGEPSLATMKKYRAVAWQTTTVSGYKGVISVPALRNVFSYMDGGGKFWMMSSRAMSYIAGLHAAGENLASYFGLVPENNLLDSPGVAKRPAGAKAPKFPDAALGYIDGRPYLDYGVMAEAADVKGTATPLFEHSLRPGKIVGTRVEGDGFRSMYTFPVGMLRDAAARSRLVKESMSFMGIPTGAAAPSRAALSFDSFQHVQPGEAWPVVVGAVAPGGVSSVSVDYRPFGSRAWSTLALTPAGDGLFSGSIPASAVGSNGIEYVARMNAGGKEISSAGGRSLPNVAAAPYGKPAQAKYGRCAQVLGARVQRPLPATGVGSLTGWAVVALMAAAMLAVALGRRRREA